MLGLAQAAQCLLVAVCLLSLPRERRPTDIAPGEKDKTEYHAEQAQSHEEESRRWYIMETGNEWPVEIVVIERREVLHPAPIDLTSGDIQKQGQEQHTTRPTCCRAATGGTLGDQQCHRAKEEGQQAQVQPREQCPHHIGMLLNPGLADHSTQRKEQRDQDQRDQERTHLLQQQASAWLWRGEQYIQRAAFLFPSHQVSPRQDGPEAQHEWQDDSHVTKGDIPLFCLNSVGITEKAQDGGEAGKACKHNRCSRCESHGHEQTQSDAPAQNSHPVISKRFAPNAAKHSTPPI